MEVLKQRAKEKVKQLNDYISFMANPKKDSKTRFFYKGEAQKLFINDCERFKEIVEYKDGSKEDHGFGHKAAGTWRPRLQNTSRQFLLRF